MADWLSTDGDVDGGGEDDDPKDADYNVESDGGRGAQRKKAKKGSTSRKKKAKAVKEEEKQHEEVVTGGGGEDQFAHSLSARMTRSQKKNLSKILNEGKEAEDADDGCAPTTTPGKVESESAILGGWHKLQMDFSSLGSVLNMASVGCVANARKMQQHVQHQRQEHCCGAVDGQPATQMPPKAGDTADTVAGRASGLSFSFILSFDCLIS